MHCTAADGKLIGEKLIGSRKPLAGTTDLEHNKKNQRIHTLRHTHIRSVGRGWRDPHFVNVECVIYSVIKKLPNHTFAG